MVGCDDEAFCELKKGFPNGNPFFRFLLNGELNELHELLFLDVNYRELVRELS